MRATCLLTAIGLGLLAGCAGGGVSAGGKRAVVEDAGPQDAGTLVALLASANTPVESRKSADRVLVAQEGRGYAPRVAVLEQLLYARGETGQEGMRVYALDQLVEADPARAGAALQLYLPRMEGETLTHACAVAVKLGDERVVGPLTRSMSRAVRMEAGDGERMKGRPEFGAIETLSGKGVVEALYGAIENSRDRSVRIAALDCVQRLESAETVRDRVAGMKAGDGWLANVKWWVAMFGVALVGEAESAQVEYLHRPEQGALVARALERHRTLKGEADYVAAPRFVTVLAYAPELEVRKSRAALLEELRDVLKTDQAAKLSRGDLLTLSMLRGALEGDLADALHRQGLEDLSDAGNAHGGLLVVQNIETPVVTAAGYPGGETGDDSRFVPGDALVQRAGMGLAVYSLAFEQVRNGEHAGVSDEELGLARAGRWNGVKVTSVETRKMRVMFYTPGGVVVDLGTVEVK